MSWTEEQIIALIQQQLLSTDGSELQELPTETTLRNDDLLYGKKSPFGETDNFNIDRVNFAASIVDPNTVTSVFGRPGPAIAAASGDYAASLVTNVPAGNITETEVQAALNQLDSIKQPVSVRLEEIAGLPTTKGNLIAANGINWVDLGVGTNGQVLSADSANPTGLKWTTPEPGGVTSWNTRTGDVVPVAGDYTAAQVTNVPAGNITEAEVQAALNQLDSIKQPASAGLDDLAGLATTKGNLIAGNADNWISLGVGTDGQVLTADPAEASGLKWDTLSDTPPGGPDTAIQFNSSGSFSGNANLVWQNGLITTSPGIANSPLMVFGAAGQIVPIFSVTSDGGSPGDLLVIQPNGDLVAGGTINGVNLLTSGGGADFLADDGAYKFIDQTPVTLVGTGDYLSLAGQEFTKSLIDLASATHVTGKLPFGNIQDITTARILGRNTAGSGIIEELDAATARSVIDVDQAGTDNSVPVTLVGPANYLSLAGQEITQALIDLTSATHITGNLPVTNLNGGSNASVNTVWRGDGAWEQVAKDQIADKAVTYPKIQDVVSNRILGRATAGAGDVEELDATATRNLIGLGVGDSPTFAGMTINTVSGITYVNNTDSDFDLMLIDRLSSTPKMFWADASDAISLENSGFIVRQNQDLVGLEVVKSSDAGIPEIQMTRYGGNGAGIVGRKANGTEGTPTNVLAGDLLFYFGIRGHDGTDFSSANNGVMRFQAAFGADWSATNRGTQFDIGVTPLNSTSRRNQLLFITGNVFVVNEAGYDYDFRVEGDTDINLITADGGLNRVGVGVALNSHNSKFHVLESDAFSGSVSDVITIGRNASSGSPSINDGVGALFQMQMLAGPNQDAARIAPVATNVGAANESTKFQIQTRSGGAALATVVELDGGTAADEMGLMLMDFSKGTMQRVSRGATDSGGSGFRSLRVPN